MSRDEAPLADDRRRALLERYRRRFHDLEEAEWECLVGRVRGEEAIRAIGRELKARGLCPHLRPSSVTVYLSQLRHLLEVLAPDAPNREELGGESEDNQPIEGQDALKTLRWLIRIQQARVRKALALERRMGDLLMDQTRKEIQLMDRLLQIELKVVLALGEPEEAPQQQGGAHDGTAAQVVDLQQRSLRLFSAVRRLGSNPQLGN